MKRLWLAVLGMLWTLPGVAAGQAASELFNPYERPKNGPPLSAVFDKVETSWLEAKLSDPKHHAAARMPDFELTDEEVLDIMSYLKSISSPTWPQISWPGWSEMSFEEMSDEEIDEMFELADEGQSVWSRARCSICHAFNGPGGEIIGGFVDLRVGGIDLQIAGTKLKRDWLYSWIEDPKSYFPNTLMPRFRFSDPEIRVLVEYLLQDEAFRPSAEPEEGDPERWEALDDPQRVSDGRSLIELSRCVLCHDIQGIPEEQPKDRPAAVPRRGSFDFLAYDLRCLSCHAIAGRGGTYAPDLTAAGSRLHRSWIADFLASPDMIRPLSQQMPKLNLTEEEVEIIADYVSGNLRDPRIPANIPGGPVTHEEIEEGREVFRSKGCISCHSTGDGPGGAVAPSLAAAGARLRAGYIWYHLENPHGWNPYSPEPDYGLSGEETRSLAAYLSAKDGLE